MTLILSRVARDGVVMAADSALTESFRGSTRILHGARKLFVHEQSASCIGTWGGGTVPNPDPLKAPIAVEFVVNEFLAQATTISSGLLLATRLAEWLGETYCANRDFIGLDVATVTSEEGVAFPAVYRLTNADTPDKPLRRFFHLHTLREPRAYDTDLDGFIIPAGDNNAQVWVDEFHAAARHAVSRTARNPLPDDIEGLSGWLPSVVRAVSDAYRSLQIGQSIGGPIACVAIRSSDGVIYTRNT
jgi:hypothetical protein